jgi:hypothetical protein
MIKSTMPKLISVQLFLQYAHCYKFNIHFQHKIHNYNTFLLPKSVNNSYSHKKGIEYSLY